MYEDEMSRERWVNFHKRLHDHQYLERIITGWYEKSISESETFNKFICLWIAFDAWVTNYLEQENLKRFDRKLEFLSDQSKDPTLSNDYRKLLQKDEFRKELIELKTKCPVRDARTKYGTKPRPFSDISDLGQLMKVLYQIRNNLFHGSKPLEPGRDQNLVSLGNQILGQLFVPLYKRIKSCR